jgi:N-methylhydantoinase A
LKARSSLRLAPSKTTTPCRSGKAYFAGAGWVETPHIPFADVKQGSPTAGPAIIETPFTSIVIDPQARFECASDGSLLVHP